MPKHLIYIVLVLLFVSCADRTLDQAELWGIDISKHQRSVDWDVVMSEESPHFVFLKATEGTLITDDSYERHARQLDSMGVLWGAYHFFGHRTSGRQQALNFIKTAKLKPGNLLPVLDIEPHRFMTDPKKSVRQARAFCNQIRSYYGVYPIIYCSTKFYESYLKDDFPSDKYTLWIADYRGDPQHLDWHFWQHTDRYRIRGIKGHVDRNVFAGGEAKLKKLTL